MKLTAKNGVSHDVKKYAMPTKGAAGSVNINGEDVTTMYTAGRGKDYTYFAIKNVGFYVAGALDSETKYELDIPEDFEGKEAADVRKSYYVPKRKKNADGSVPAGSSDATDAPHTEVRDGKEVAVNPDGSVVSQELHDQALAEGNDGGLKAEGVNQEDVDNGNATSGQVESVSTESDGTTDPDGNPIDEAASKEAAKPRKGRK